MNILLTIIGTLLIVGGGFIGFVSATASVWGAPSSIMPLFVILTGIICLVYVHSTKLK